MRIKTLCKVWLLEILMTLMHMEGSALRCPHTAADEEPEEEREQDEEGPEEGHDAAENEDGVPLALMERVLRLIQRSAAELEEEVAHLPPDAAGDAHLPPAMTRVVLARAAVLTKTVEEALWRLTVLCQMEPTPRAKGAAGAGGGGDGGRRESTAGTGNGRVWKWAEAVAVLRAPPSTLLNMCMQRSEYALGGEAARHFALDRTQMATLQLAEWASLVTPLLDFQSLKAPLSKMGSMMLCVDVAAAAAASPSRAQVILKQAKGMLEGAAALGNGAEPGPSPVASLTSSSGGTPLSRAASMGSTGTPRRDEIGKAAERKSNLSGPATWHGPPPSATDLQPPAATWDARGQAGLSGEAEAEASGEESEAETEAQWWHPPAASEWEEVTWRGEHCARREALPTADFFFRSNREDEEIEHKALTVRGGMQGG
ncbi:hypothetical protein CYMTET_31920 [Cymbomonas tetramitiformis]|uniref:Uncharacterized protein n=1 Tax=Cymbomonas tetramitiformis TaxID=36881 RepID=A0AAE0KSE8_9CHLO|nr:hypothetical protein CYMTET_31920 [Cymbomonas tetramitiformis]